MGRCNQPFTKFVEVGRVVYIAFGRNAGKICAIVDIIDQNRALVDGPCSGVLRHSMSFNRLHLTKFTIPIKHSDKTLVVRKAWTEANVNEKWVQTKWAKSLQSKRKRRTLTDFDRFKLMLSKRMRNSMVEKEVKKLKRKEKLTKKAAFRAARDKKLGKPPRVKPEAKPKVKKQRKTPKPKKAPKKTVETPKETAKTQ